MNEDKQKICKMLVPVLQQTRALRDLESLKFDAKTEVVTATLSDGCAMTINVAMDSGIAMIRDILNQIDY